MKLILYQALAADIGLVLRTPEPERARQALYAARREINDPDLAILQIRTAGVPDGDLVLIKQKFSTPPPAGPEEVLGI